MLKNIVNKGKNEKKVIHRFILDFSKLKSILKNKRSIIN